MNTRDENKVTILSHTLKEFSGDRMNQTTGKFSGLLIPVHLGRFSSTINL
jgi:hypothetical protein